MKKTTQKKPVSSYTASIKILGKKYTSEGTTAQQAIENLAPEGVKKGMSILSVTNGTATREKVLNTFQTSRMFSPSRIVREIALKNLSNLFTI